MSLGTATAYRAWSCAASIAHNCAPLHTQSSAAFIAHGHTQHPSRTLMHRIHCAESCAAPITQSRAAFITHNHALHCTWSCSASIAHNHAGRACWQSCRHNHAGTIMLAGQSCWRDHAGTIMLAGQSCWQGMLPECACAGLLEWSSEGAKLRTRSVSSGPSSARYRRSPGLACWLVCGAQQRLLLPASTCLDPMLGCAQPKRCMLVWKTTLATGAGAVGV